ncbi:hypothetical protein GCM10017783_10530 [Deinococcus piscis]|uniref:Uncharacterized protein n=1 Tax=Deinococcus piscis TaxID=394230 RepID=A0ABQ3K8P5_9DEIO|nr:hypothetical protein [Deinococcus piscis]GHG00296.1 hypothetical protein GCM10017783_10530 [Deinococcus piscis]
MPLTALLLASALTAPAPPAPRPEDRLWPSRAEYLRACFTPRATEDNRTPAADLGAGRSVQVVLPSELLRGDCRLDYSDLGEYGRPGTPGRATRRSTILHTLDLLASDDLAATPTVGVNLYAEASSAGEPAAWNAALLLLDAQGRELGCIKPQTGMVRFFPHGGQQAGGLGLSSLVFRELPRPLVRQAAQLLVEVNWGGEVKRYPLEDVLQR